MTADDDGPNFLSELLKNAMYTRDRNITGYAVTGKEYLIIFRMKYECPKALYSPSQVASDGDLVHAFFFFFIQLELHSIG